jgi:hypothetical protein
LPAQPIAAQQRRIKTWPIKGLDLDEGEANYLEALTGKKATADSRQHREDVVAPGESDVGCDAEGAGTWQ